jgi:hypothetical protein
MKSWIASLLILLAPITSLADVPPDDLLAARTEILPLFEAMQAAANARDAEAHVSFYAHESLVSS